MLQLDKKYKISFSRMSSAVSFLLLPLQNECLQTKGYYSQAMVFVSYSTYPKHCCHFFFFIPLETKSTVLHLKLIKGSSFKTAIEYWIDFDLLFTPPFYLLYLFTTALFSVSPRHITC